MSDTWANSTATGIVLGDVLSRPNHARAQSAGPQIDGNGGRPPVKPVLAAPGTHLEQKEIPNHKAGQFRKKTSRSVELPPPKPKLRAFNTKEKHKVANSISPSTSQSSRPLSAPSDFSSSLDSAQLTLALCADRQLKKAKKLQKKK